MIAIIDYGLGNGKAFANVYKQLRMPFKIVSEEKDFTSVDKIILPGVGAFDHAMSQLQRSGLRNILDKLVLQEKMPILGVCIGMQILAVSSEEGTSAGLGWVDGKVKKFNASVSDHKICLPHMGWNTVLPIRENPLFKNIGEARFYFLHSYYVECNNDDSVIARTEYCIKFSCAVNIDNIYGVQFHPEKSHHNGMKLLENFGNL